MLHLVDNPPWVADRRLGGIVMGALPVAESSDLSNGQRSARNELALPSEASAGHRNPECKVSKQDNPPVTCGDSPLYTKGPLAGRREKPPPRLVRDFRQHTEPSPVPRQHTVPSPVPRFPRQFANWLGMTWVWVAAPLVRGAGSAAD